MIIASCSLGASQTCLELALQHTKTRHQFGQPLASHQSIQFKLADMATKLQSARLMVRSAAAAMDAKLPDFSALCAMSKQHATDMGFEVSGNGKNVWEGVAHTRLLFSSLDM